MIFEDAEIEEDPGEVVEIEEVDRNARIGETRGTTSAGVVPRLADADDDDAVDDGVQPLPESLLLDELAFGEWCAACDGWHVM